MLDWVAGAAFAWSVGAHGAEPAEPVTSRGSAGYELVEVPPGKFNWVDPDGKARSEVYEVRVASAFWLGRTEVTQGLWAEVMGENPATRRRVWGDAGGLPEDLGPCGSYQDTSLVGDELPVMCVSWCDAVLFANELSRREGLEPAYLVPNGLPSGASFDWCAQTAPHVVWSTTADGYRLPTEAEWEHAARAGGHAVYAGAESERTLCTAGNVADKAAVNRWPAWEQRAPCDDGVPGLAPVASFATNPWGLWDLSGNVAEWVWDQAGALPGRATTGGATDGRGDRLYRGGCWAYGAAEARVAARTSAAPGGRYYGLGLRLARSSF